jgi:1-acyl-sn-glycerol-3-phosphate acyltransferase
MLYRILRPLAILLCKIFFRFQSKGRENIPKRGGFILASNHLSYLDPVALGVACPRKLNFMAKEELFVNPFFSWFVSTLGAFPVKRDSADLSALKEAIRRLNKGMVLVLFPEGSRRFDGVSSEPQSGIGFLAVKLNVPVIPAFIKGTEVALPKGAKFIKPAEISVQFGKQILIERRMPYQDIARLIMEKIRHLAC